MNKKSLKNLTVLLILIISMLFCNIVFAAGTFSVGKSEIELKEGKTTTFKIDGSTSTGKVEISSSDVSVAAVSSSSVWIEKSTSTITVTAKKAGTATITVSGVVADEKGVEAEVTKTIKVIVKAEEKPVEQEKPTTPSTPSTPTTPEKPAEQPKEKSNNAYLSTLGVTPKEYDFSGFKKNTMNYSVTIPYDVDTLKVLYKTADANAKVKVTGNSDFEVGSNNKITIKVTAEDGKTTKTYTIKVTKLAEEEEKPGNIIDEEVEGLYLTSLSLDGINISPEFAKDTYAYTAKLSDSNTNEIEVKATVNKAEANIEISGNTNLVVGENTINIVVKQEGSVAQTVYQIKLIKEEVLAPTTDLEDSNIMNNLIGNIKNYAIIAAIVVLLVILVVIILIILLRKENKRLKEENDNETVEEYDVYTKDENEFENNKVEEKTEETEEIEEYIAKETETKNKRRTRKEKGRHSK